MENVNLLNIHPGEILNEEFLKPMGITAYRLAKETRIPATRVSEIIHGRRGISADTALRLSAFFGNSVDFWMGIQNEYEVREERSRIAEELQQIRSYGSISSTRASSSSRSKAASRVTTSKATGKPSS